MIRIASLFWRKRRLMVPLLRGAKEGPEKQGEGAGVRAFLAFRGWRDEDNGVYR